MKIIKEILLVLFLMIVAINSSARENDCPVDSNTVHTTKHKNQKSFDIREQLQAFYPLQQDAVYSITVCADLPVNDKPNCVFKKGEPGHVFLILSKQDESTGKITERSFGFYPRVPVSCLIKQVRSKIMDNSNREYDASIKKQLTAVEFELVLDRCKVFAVKKYNLKKYNCYDYVLEVFNSLPGIEKLPITTVRFPFIFGRGGSPCGLYKDLKKLSVTGSALAPFISFGSFVSPDADRPQNLIALIK